MEDKHLNQEDLLAAIRRCKGYDGTSNCEGCPNAEPGTEDENGFCKCRFDLHDEMIRILEGIVVGNTAP